jgi:hypothetical protein
MGFLAPLLAQGFEACERFSSAPTRRQKDQGKPGIDEGNTLPRIDELRMGEQRGIPRTWAQPAKSIEQPVIVNRDGVEIPRPAHDLPVGHPHLQVASLKLAARAAPVKAPPSLSISSKR